MSNKSYKRYKQYRTNRYQYDVDQTVFPVGMIIIGALLIRYWKIVIGIIAIALGLFIFYKNRRKHVVKSTVTGYVNKNKQKNNGCTYEQGTDNNQKFYAMECLLCGHRYKANGTDIWQRKCPNCQGGKP